MQNKTVQEIAGRYKTKFHFKKAYEQKGNLIKAI